MLKEGVPMKMFVAVTDGDWYGYLSSINPDEVNFWKPSGKQGFKALEPNELFLFKLHSPNDFIVGGGFFVRYSLLPLSLAWEAFGNKNGAAEYGEFLHAIYKYRKLDRQIEPDPIIGCIILAEPFFFDSRDKWIPIPPDWSSNIVQGKTYSTETNVGKDLYKQVLDRVSHSPAEFAVGETPDRYGNEQIVTPRLGQGAFRVVVTEAYHRRCAISGERTLPVLEAAHIKPYSLGGVHNTNNGLLFRKDIHTLFDRGYITVTKDHHIEVSKRIKEDYGNGREYYAYHGKKLIELPDRKEDMPSEDCVSWHNEKVFIA